MIYRIKELRLDASARGLSDRRGSIRVPARVFDALSFLLENRARAVSRDELIRHVWGRENVSDAQLGQIVLAARRLVGDQGDVQGWIRTVPGFGYQWVGEVEVSSGEAHLAAPEVDVVEPGKPAEPTLPAAHAVSAVDSGAEPDAESANSRSPPPPSLSAKRRWATALAALLVALVAIAVGYLARESAVPAFSANRVVVLPIEVATDVDAAWMKLGAMDLIGGRLRDSGLVVPPTESVLQLLAIHRGALEDADRDALQRAAHADLVVLGGVDFALGRWRVVLHARRPDGLRIQVEGRATDALGAAASAADRLLAALGRVVDPETDAQDERSELLQRARAASLENDPERARALLEDAPALERASLEVRLRIAEIDSRTGRYAEAEKSLNSLLEAAGASDWFRARVLGLRGSIKLRRNDADAGREDFNAAVALLADGRHPLAYGKALNGRSIAYRRQGDWAKALADYGLARLALEQAGDDLALARLTVSLALFEKERFHPLAAIENLIGAAQQFETYGAIDELGTALTNLSQSQGDLLRWADALDSTERSMALLPRIVDPARRAQILLGRAQVLLAIGRLREAAALLEQVSPEILNSQMLEALHAGLLRAQLAREAGNVAVAAAAATALWQRMPATGAAGMRSAAALTLVRALLAAGDVQGAERIVATLAAEVADATAVDVNTEIARAEWLIASGQHAEAERGLRRALATADTHNSPLEMASTTDVLTRLLIADRRIDDSAALVGRVAPHAEQDFRCALLLAWWYRSQANPTESGRYLAVAKGLAGERNFDAAMSGLSRSD